MLLAIANQPIDTNSTYATGGDVSRFQRRTVPTRPRSEGAQAVEAIGRMTGEMVRAARGDAPAAGGGQASATQAGPTVRVARGNNVTYVPVGAR
jgi:pilus assembly protein CpaB